MDFEKKLKLTWGWVLGITLVLVVLIALMGNMGAPLLFFPVIGFLIYFTINIVILRFFICPCYNTSGNDTSKTA